MEQAREEAQKQLKIPLRCPRCSSLNTRFRYFNNNSLSQPRHYCRSCKRQWTAGGKQRLIPIGDKTRNGEPTKTSSSEGGHSRSHPLQPPLSQWEQHQQNLTMMTTMVSPNCDTTLFQPITTAAVSPSNYFRDQISCLYAAQTSIQQVSNHHVGVGTNMAVPQEWNVQTMTPQQALSQQNSVTSKFYQTHTEALPLSNSYINGVAQSSWPVNSLPPQDITYGSSFTMSNACLENNLSRDTGDKTDTEDTAYVNVDEWLNLQGNDPE